jgi:hypothetical protein
MSGFKCGGVRVPTTRLHPPLVSRGRSRRPAKIPHASCAPLRQPAAAARLNNMRQDMLRKAVQSSMPSTAGMRREPPRERGGRR